MIATNEAVDILRHGWQDAASTLAADVPEVAELLQARLEMAVASDDLTERHLLDTIQEMESVTSRAGSPSGPDLARRLRRTVYEYLLALDAARPLEIAPTRVDQPVRAFDSPLVGAEEVAALGHASRSREDAAEVAGDDLDGTAADAVTGATRGTDGIVAAESVNAPSAPGAPASRRRFALRRRPRPTTETAPELPQPPDAATGSWGAHAASHDILDVEAAEPGWRYTPAAEPSLFDGGLSDAPDGELDPNSRPHDGIAPAQAEAAPDAQPASIAGPDASIPEPHLRDVAEEPVSTFVAPRAGFHIVEDAPLHRVDQEEPRLQMPAFSADEGADPDAAHVDLPTPEVEATAAGQPEAPAVLTPTTDAAVAEPVAPETAAEGGSDVVGPAEMDPGDVGSDFLAWRQPESAAPAHPAASPPPPSPPPAQPLPPDFVPPATLHFADEAMPSLAPPSAPPSPAQDPVDEADGDSRGWGVRRHGDTQGSHRSASGHSASQADDDPFENNTRLAEMRRRIEERLRRKRCDEAAALLQEIAQETGGRAVAELAMNAGDRCRALGKSNAALNCYLAAARSDPVYELPLSRLADVCIDNQDTELAVSYLERIARIYRFREDDRAALRTYRRIATIAPYREDVLTLLMNAQRTGQLQ